MKVGILGAGHIAHKMARTLRIMADRAAVGENIVGLDGISAVADPSFTELPYAVGARDLGRAQKFAAQYGIAKAYGSYEELVSDPEIDLIYVATPHSFHHPHVRLALEHGKNVLCEKTFMLDAAEAEDVLNLAREKGLFVAEAAWPRYMPFSRQIRSLINDGVIGEPCSLSASLGYYVIDKERIIRADLGGGALLDLGIYPMHFAALCFGTEVQKITASAVLAPSGIDKMNSFILDYSNGRQATLHSTALGCNSRYAVINGSEAYMLVDNINNPSWAKVCDRDSKLLSEYHAPEQITGFEYQVMACAEAIKKGWIEHPDLPHAEIIRILRILDGVREQCGIKYKD